MKIRWTLWTFLHLEKLPNRNFSKSTKLFPVLYTEWWQMKCRSWLRIKDSVIIVGQSCYLENMKIGICKRKREREERTKKRKEKKNQRKRIYEYKTKDAVAGLYPSYRFWHQSRIFALTNQQYGVFSSFPAWKFFNLHHSLLFLSKDLL